MNCIATPLRVRPEDEVQCGVRESGAFQYTVTRARMCVGNEVRRRKERQLTSVSSEAAAPVRASFMWRRYGAASEELMSHLRIRASLAAPRRGRRHSRCSLRNPRLFSYLARASHDGFRLPRPTPPAGAHLRVRASLAAPRRGRRHSRAHCATSQQPEAVLLPRSGIS